MEQTIIDFLSKALDLISNNRLPTTPSSSLQPTASQQKNFNPFSFQLCVEPKYNFYGHVPDSWRKESNKLLVIEFLLCLKPTNMKFLSEQWIFDLSELSSSNLEDTVDSLNTLYKKLSVLLRTIALLTVTLPLYCKVKEISSELSSAYAVEHSISFTRDTLTSWHPSLLEEKDIVNFSTCDFVLPGRTFSFKVRYSNNFNFLRKVEEGLSPQEKVNHNFTSPIPSGLICPEDGAPSNGIHLARRAFSDNHYNKDIRALNPVSQTGSPPEVSSFHNNDFSHVYKVERSLKFDPVAMEGNNLTNSSAQRRNSTISSTTRIWDVSKLMEGSRVPFKTMESESFGENDVYIRENDEDKFTEILTWKDINTGNQSPTRLVLKERSQNNDYGILRGASDNSENNKLLVSTNMEPIKKIVEQTDDDKIAELLHSIEKLKVLALDSQRSRSSTGKEEKSDSQDKEQDSKKGLKFEVVSNQRKNSGEDLLYPFSELNEFKDLYLEIKRSGSAK